MSYGEINDDMIKDDRELSAVQDVLLQDGRHGIEVIISPQKTAAKA